MSAKEYPVHMMIKPEGREIFPIYIQSQIELFETFNGIKRSIHLITTLSPEQVDLIYPQTEIPIEFKQEIASKPTEHFVFHGEQNIYDLTKDLKGKFGEQGIRGTISKQTARVGLHFEKWQNFVHSSDNLNETVNICKNLNENINICQECVAKDICLK